MKNANRTNRIQAVATNQERLALQLIAERMGIKESEALRELVKDRAKEWELWEAAREIINSLRKENG